MTESAEQQLRGGTPNDGPVGGAPGPSAETDRGAPSGLPNEDHEATPLGTTEEDPGGEGEGAEDQPGIPTGGEPPTAG